jgi:hypothetical protein
MKHEIHHRVEKHSTLNPLPELAQSYFSHTYSTADVLLRFTSVSSDWPFRFIFTFKMLYAFNVVHMCATCTAKDNVCYVLRNIPLRIIPSCPVAVHLTTLTTPSYLSFHGIISHPQSPVGCVLNRLKVSIQYRPKWTNIQFARNNAFHTYAYI